MPRRLRETLSLTLLSALITVPALAYGQTAAVSEASAAQQSPPNQVRLEGTVLLPDGKPAAGTAVYLTLSRWNINNEDNPNQLTVIKTVNTDAQGRFVIDWVEAPQTSNPRDGQMQIVAFGSGVAPDWATVERREGATPAPFTLKLQKIGKLLTGVVNDSAGKPLPGVSVGYYMVARANYEDGQGWMSLTLPKELRERHSVVTDAKGAFSLPGLAVGKSVSISAAVEKEGFNTGGGYFSEEALKQPLVFTLQRSTRIEGKVESTEPAFSPSQVYLVAYTTTKQGRGSQFLRARADGTFTLKQVTPGPVEIEVMPQSDSEWQPQGRVTVTVKEGETLQNVIIKADAVRGTKVTGKAVDAETGKGVQGVMLNFESGNGGTTTGEDGSFTFYHRPGTLVLRSWGGSATGAAADYAIPENFRVQVNIGPEPVTVPDIKLTRALGVTVKVVDAGGKPVAGATLRNESETYPGYPSQGAPRTDVKGLATIRNLDPLKPVRLIAFKEGLYSENAIVEAKNLPPGPITLTLKPGLAVRLTGQVIDDAGKPVTGAKVQVQANYGKWGDFPVTLATDAQGMFTTSPLTPNAKFKLNIAPPEGTSVTVGDWQAERGVTHDFGVIRIVRLLGTLSGIVTDAGGKPAAAVRVWNTGEAGKRAETVTDAKGRFRLAGLHKGPALLFVEKGQQAQTFTVAQVVAPAANVRLVLGKPLSLPAGSAVPLTGTTRAAAAQRSLARRIAETALLETGKDDETKGKRHRAVAVLTLLDPRRGGEALARLEDGGQDGYYEALAALALERSAVEAAACYAQIGSPERRTYGLITTIRRLADTRPEMARALLPATLTSARTIAAIPYQTVMLAQTASLMRKLNVPGGEELLRECAAHATKFAVKEWEAYARGVVAEQLYETDPDGAIALLTPLQDQYERQRHFGNIARRVGRRSPEEAVKMIEQAGGNEWQQKEQMGKLCWHIAPYHPDKASAIADSLNSEQQRVQAHLWIAERLAGRDSARARASLDKALASATSMMSRIEDFSDWYNAPARFFARITPLARRLNHPEATSLTGRALAARPPLSGRHGDEYSQQNALETAAKLAVVLAEHDPTAARALLEVILPQVEALRMAKDRQYSEKTSRDGVALAAMMVDPALCARFLESCKKANRPVDGLQAAEWAAGTTAKREEIRNRIMPFGQPDEDE